MTYIERLLRALSSNTCDKVKKNTVNRRLQVEWHKLWSMENAKEDKHLGLHQKTMSFRSASSSADS